MNSRGSNLGLREERALAKSGSRKKPRRTSLRHLPKAKQAEIAWARDLVFAEFAEAIAGRRAPDIRDGKILKLILHGPYASGAWVDDPTGRYFADYEFLVVVSSDRLADVGEFWLECEKKLLFAFANREYLRTPVRLTVLTFSKVGDQIRQGSRYFQNLIEEGVVLHDTPGLFWPDYDAPASLDMAADAELHLEEGLNLVAEFLGSAKLSAANGWFRKAAFDLHQATERLYHIVLLVLVGQSPHTHNIVDLRKRAEAASEPLRAVWPAETREDRRCFELLRSAYNKSRYHRHYRVSESEARWMIEQVEFLSHLTEEVCEAQVARLHLQDESASEPYDLPVKAGRQIVADYDAALAAHPGPIVDVRLLPHPKEAIKSAILSALAGADDLEAVRNLTEKFLGLAKWLLMHEGELAILQAMKARPDATVSDQGRQETELERGYRRLANRVAADTIILGAELQHGRLSFAR